ncbi:MAG: hypothetical protein ABIP51_14280 [Bacteroidia bacterium]
MKTFLTVSLIIFCCDFFSQNTCPPSLVCSNYNGIPNGAGAGGQNGELSAATDGCLGGEHNSSWITVNITIGGTFGFTINPNTNNNDFDFAVWGPNSACPPTTAPIRCSYAVNNNNFAGNADNGNTGISTTINSLHPTSESDNTEGSGGNGWVNSINVTAGQTYLILIDNFTTNSGYQIDFNGSSSIACPLPIELADFSVESKGEDNFLKWSTFSERNASYYKIENATDAQNWKEIGILQASGNSNSLRSYSMIHKNVTKVINYYRLTQYDFDGQFKAFKIIVIDNFKGKLTIVRRVNIVGQNVSKDYKGLKIVTYSDGSVKKILNN